MLEVFVFSGENNSARFDERLEQLIAQVTATIDVSMYSLTHNELTKALVAVHQKEGVAVQVITDHTLMHSKDSTVLQLLAVGIPLWV